MWGKKKDSKDVNTTTIKQTTKIKEKYTIPTSSINPEVAVSTGNDQMVQKNYQTSDLPVQGSNYETVGVRKSLEKGKRSRSSSSSSEKNRNMRIESSLTNPKNIGLIQDAPLVQSNVLPTSYDTRYNTSEFYSDGTGNVHLGKNLYGETGYASPYYLIQQPFPGQTVYVQNWKQNIPERTRNKFLRSSYPEQNLNLVESQQVNAQTNFPSVGQTYDTYINKGSNLYSDTNRITFESKLQSPTKHSITKPLTTGFNEGVKMADNSLTTNLKQVESSLGSKNETVIKQKTKIKENYTVPAQEINKIVNVPTRDSDLQYTMKSQNQNVYTQPPAISSTVKYTEPQVVTSNVQSEQRYGLIQNEPQVTNMSAYDSGYNAGNVNVKSGSKDQTVIKQKTKIKEKYTFPAQNVNVTSQPQTVTNQSFDQRYPQPYNQSSYQQETNLPVNTTVVTGKTTNLPVQTSNIPTQNLGYPVQSSSYGTSRDAKNLQYIQSKYGQNEFQMNTGRTSTLQDVNAESKMRRRQSSSSSSSSKEKSRKMNLDTGFGSKSGLNIETINQPTLTQQGYATTGNVQTGYGPLGEQTGMYGSNVVANTSYRDTVYTGVPLGKNLYGQTGYASLQYTIQQPFPGQTVYVPESPSKISNRTKARFSEPVL